MGAGYYVHGSHPDWIDSAGEGAIADEIVGDLTSGLGPDRIRAGFIGEIGCSWPMTSRERRVLRAAGLAQRATGAPLMVHPGRDPPHPTRSSRCSTTWGRISSGRPSVTSSGPSPAPSSSSTLGRRGAWLSLDCFGLETAFYPLNPRVAMPNDGGRLALAETVIAAGLGGRCCSPRMSARSTAWPRLVATATTTCCAT